MSNRNILWSLGTAFTSAIALSAVLLSLESFQAKQQHFRAEQRCRTYGFDGVTPTDATLCFVDGPEHRYIVRLEEAPAHEVQARFEHDGMILP
jgi:hypothetical protein